MTDDLPATVTLEQLAKVFHVSPKTLHQIRSKHPDRLPPSIEYGGRRVLFLKKDVEKWLDDRRQVV